MRLTVSERVVRLMAICALASVTIALRTVDPVSVQPWLPISCGAITGVPCILCGTTRALHYVLNGDLSRALYFNWLVFPIAGTAITLIARAAVEVCSANRIVWFAPLRVTPRMISTSLAALTLAWVLQVYLAISQHKTELLNPRGPLYALLVR